MALACVCASSPPHTRWPRWWCLSTTTPRQPQLGSLLPLVIILISPQRRTGIISGAVTGFATNVLTQHKGRPYYDKFAVLYSMSCVSSRCRIRRSWLYVTAAVVLFSEHYRHHIARSRSAAANLTEADGSSVCGGSLDRKTPLFQEMAAYIVTYFGCGAGQAADRSANRQIIVFSVQGNFILQTVCINGADTLRSGLAAAWWSDLQASLVADRSCDLLILLRTWLTSAADCVLTGWACLCLSIRCYGVARSSANLGLFCGQLLRSRGTIVVNFSNSFAIVTLGWN